MQQSLACSQHYVDARGLRFSYLTWGDRAQPPLVLLHGLTGHARIWELMAPQLAPQFRLYAPDQRGHGDTQHASSYTTADYVADLEALVSIWGLDRFVLMGLSMGGHNGIAYAAAFPQRVSRLIVIDIPPKLDLSQAPDWEQMQAAAHNGHPQFATVEEAFADARAGNATAPDANLRHRTQWNLRELPNGDYTWKHDHTASAHYAPEDLRPRLAHVACPTLLVRAGLTQWLPRDVAERMAAAFPHGELVEVPESGHSIPTDCPEKLARLVLEWLAR